MKIFYCCWGSAHTSVVSSHIHLGILPIDRLARFEEINDLKMYDRTPNTEIGTVFYVGDDQWGNQIYFMGFGPQKLLVRQGVTDYLRLRGIDTHDLLFVDAIVNATWVTCVGGYLSRRLGLTWIGRPLTILGILQNYRAFTRLVRSVYDQIDRVKVTETDLTPHD